MKTSKSNPIDFRQETYNSHILQRDGSGNYVEALVPLEFRTDPLTGRRCRVVDFPLDRIIRPDLDRLEKKSLELTCPFCRPLLEKITPNFPHDLVPGGNIRRGRAYGFPNARPHEVYGAVVVMSDRHFIRPGEFTAETIRDALLVAQSCLRHVSEYDAAARYHFIAWNYLPPSGGSLVHPHLQTNAGYYPTDFQKQILEASDSYFEARGTNYWSDLLEQEKKAGERYVGKTGATEWLTAFVPRGRLSDVIAVFPGRTSILELNEQEINDFSEGLLKVIDYMDGLNLLSFNMSTYSGFSGDSFRAHARITPRATLLYSPLETSDQFYYQILQGDNICIISPEIAAERLRPKFDE